MSALFCTLVKFLQSKFALRTSGREFCTSPNTDTEWPWLQTLCTRSWMIESLNAVRLSKIWEWRTMVIRCRVISPARRWHDLCDYGCTVCCCRRNAHPLRCKSIAEIIATVTRSLLSSIPSFQPVSRYTHHLVNTKLVISYSVLLTARNSVRWDEGRMYWIFGFIEVRSPEGHSTLRGKSILSSFDVFDEIDCREIDRIELCSFQMKDLSSDYFGRIERPTRKIFLFVLI